MQLNLMDLLQGSEPIPPEAGKPEEREKVQRVRNGLIESAPALYGAIMFYGASVLPRLRAMSHDERKRLCDELLNCALEMPLWEPLTPKEANALIFPTWSDKPVTGPFTIALMVFTLFVMCGEREEMCSGLVEVWPIREAVFMAGEPAPVI